MLTETGASPVRGYEPEPCHAVTNAVGVGYRAAVAGLSSGLVLAVDGPAAVDWDLVASEVCDALAARELAAKQLDTREHFAPWPDILELTASTVLEDDPDFAPLSQAALADFFAAVPEIEAAPHAVTVVFGPGAALVEHDKLWYADLPKRYAEAEITAGTGRNLGQPAGTGPGTTRRLFYLDWPVLDRHRDALISEVDLWLDTQDPQAPTWLEGPPLRKALADLAVQPFRTRPTFNTTSWGGHWAQKQLGFNPTAPNTALGYELIAPESGILLGDPDGPRVEIPLHVLVTLHPEEILGEDVHATFGTSFPIRFDYLDTVGGGNLSVHCHPQPDYMRRVFGWPYTQHETYYMMVGGPDRRVFLGLREGADIEAFRREADRAVHDGVPFDIERYVQTFPAEQHRLFLIPAGTPHGSGEGNVVLEISATPYLYSLRFYDWLRKDSEGKQRPVHVGHAFDNLNTARSGKEVVRDLAQEPQLLRAGDGWREEVIGRLPEMFFEVRRLELEAGAIVEDTTADDSTSDDTTPDDATSDDATAAHNAIGHRFHVLNVVEGDGVLLSTQRGHRNVLAYAETLTVPASVGAYRVRALGTGPVRYVKALVR
jgi:mannose-6-phosphate isomerase class I